MEEDKGNRAMEDTGMSKDQQPQSDDLKPQDKGPVYPELFPPPGWDNRLSTTGTGYTEEKLKELRMRAAECSREYLAKKEMDKDGKQNAEWIAMQRMEDRKVTAKAFCAEYKYNNDNRQETKTCVLPNSCHPWNEKYLSGLSWVGVHGGHSICVVTLADNLDMTRVSTGNRYKHDIMCDFRRTAIHKIEVLPTLSSNDWMNIVKPFGVVCVNRDINDEGYDEQNAIQFLQTEFSKGGSTSTSTTFSTFKTVQTAISALQRLCKRTFNKANEIQVSVMDPEYEILGNQLCHKNWTIEELRISEISKYLIAINDPDFRGESEEVTIDDVELFILQKELLHPKPKAPVKKFKFFE